MLRTAKKRFLVNILISIITGRTGIGIEVIVNLQVMKFIIFVDVEKDAAG